MKYTPEKDRFLFISIRRMVYFRFSFPIRDMVFQSISKRKFFQNSFARIMFKKRGRWQWSWSLYYEVYCGGIWRNYSVHIARKYWNYVYRFSPRKGNYRAERGKHLNFQNQWYFFRISPTILVMKLEYCLGNNNSRSIQKPFFSFQKGSWEKEFFEGSLYPISEEKFQSIPKNRCSC